MAKKILLVEDDPKILHLERAILTGVGFLVDTASRGREAIEKLTTTEYDAIVLDIVMPEIDGYEIARRIRQLDTNQHTPVIMVTALSETDAMRQAFGVGAVVFLKKPFTAEAFRSAVRSVVR